MFSSTRFRDWVLLLAGNLIWASRVAARRADIIGFVLLGIGQVCAQLLITWGVKLSLASNAALLMLTLPVSTAVIAYFILGERMSAVRWVSFAFAIAGVAACSANGLRGLNLASSALLARYSPLQVLLYSYYVVFVFMLPATIYSEPQPFFKLPHFGPVVWFGLFILAVFQYFLSMVIFLNVFTRLDATQASVLAAVILQEHLTATMIAGGVLVLASTLLATLRDNRETANAAESA